MRSPNTLLLTSLAFVALLGLVAVSSDLLPPANARGGAEGEPAPAAEQVDPSHGPIYFDQAVRYIADGKAGIHSLTDFFADLHDVSFSVGAQRHEGHMRLWLKTPDKYRFELRQKKNVNEPGQRITTKILNGSQMWILHPGGDVQRMHGSGADGAGAIAQVQDDRRRLLDLARFLTLDGLKGPGVTFLNEGFTTGSGTFAGNWVRVRRRLQGGADVVFYLAHEADKRDPRRRRATYPGVVKIEGDPRTNEPTEYYLLKSWRQGPQFRYPTEIQAFSQARPGAALDLFLHAWPADIRINVGLQSSLFEPPGASPVERK
ncbi:MAG: hypothetical protein O2894_03785 [Planctomycetota bacterium]|nr:hypothetical protein [Planctomycetota bacterium]